MDLNQLYQSFKDISSFLKFSDEESIDIIKEKCNNIIIDYISKLNIIGYIYSGLVQPIFVFPKIKSENNYMLSFSSLDGIKNINSNISVGTIFCVYKYDNDSNSLKDIVTSGYCLYGNKTIIVESNGHVCNQFILNQNNNFVLKNNLSIENKNTKLYSINSSKTYEQDINTLVKTFRREGYNQRWIGSMVADCHHILTNGGIFMYPTCKEFPNGKLNYLIQVLPLCNVFQGAGGIGIIGNHTSILKNYKSFNLNNNNSKYLSDIILCNLNEYKNIITILDIEENIKC